jgi:hypothetical protein
MLTAAANTNNRIITPPVCASRESGSQTDRVPLVPVYSTFTKIRLSIAHHRADPADELPIEENGRAFPPNHLLDSWCDYLYWDIELDAS